MPEELKSPKMTLEIVSQKGFCGAGHEVGQKFDLSGSTPEGLCQSALHSAYPTIFALRWGADFPWEKEKGVAHIACPDADNPLVMKITRED
jgi:uncharacterized repeat protein (TIGR04076 family)